MRGLAADGMTMMVRHPRDVVRPRGADRVVFMDDGIIVEQGRPDEVLGAPQHPRTKDFLARVLNPSRRVLPVASDPGAPEATDRSPTGLKPEALTAGLKPVDQIASRQRCNHREDSLRRS
jgi:ABC-type glutathione transport system ATPase component